MPKEKEERGERDLTSGFCSFFSSQQGLKALLWLSSQPPLHPQVEINRISIISSINTWVLEGKGRRHSSHSSTISLFCHNTSAQLSEVWSPLPTSLGLLRQRQEDGEFKSRLGYRVRPSNQELRSTAPWLVKHAQRPGFLLQNSGHRWSIAAYGKKVSRLVVGQKDLSLQ